MSISYYIPHSTWRQALGAGFPLRLALLRVRFCPAGLFSIDTQCLTLNDKGSFRQLSFSVVYTYIDLYIRAFFRGDTEGIYKQGNFVSPTHSTSLNRIFGLNV